VGGGVMYKLELTEEELLFDYYCPDSPEADIN
jgi:hypothetical protein